MNDAMTEVLSKEQDRRTQIRLRMIARRRLEETVSDLIREWLWRDVKIGLPEDAKVRAIAQPVVHGVTTFDVWVHMRSDQPAFGVRLMNTVTLENGQVIVKGKQLLWRGFMGAEHADYGEDFWGAALYSVGTKRKAGER